jgi:hypothetical protein
MKDWKDIVIYAGVLGGIWLAGLLAGACVSHL